LPAIEAGLAARGRNRADFEITGIPLIGSGRDAQSQDRRRAEVRKQIAFYGSTPAYRGVLELHGWGPLHEDLHLLSKAGRWDDMADLINDEILDAFAVVGAPPEVARELRRRFDGLFDRVSLGFGNDIEIAAQLATAFNHELG